MNLPINTYNTDKSGLTHNKLGKNSLPKIVANPTSDTSSFL